MGRIRTPVFYGWWVALTAAAGLFVGAIPIVVFSFGVFLRPIAQEFHEGRGAVSFAFTLFNVIQAISVPFAGWLMDRFGVRRVILPAMILESLLLMLSRLCSGNIWQLYTFYGTLGFLTAGAGPVAYSKVISQWFDRHRGLALGIMMLGLGFGALVMPSLAQYLIAQLGWHLAYVVVGAGILLVSLPLVAVYLKERPEQLGLLPDGEISARSTPRAEQKQSDRGMSWAEARRTRTFWFLLSSFVLVAASVQACSTHLAAILADRGSHAELAALATSLLGAGVLIGRTGSGYLLDRFFAPRIAALIFAGAAGGIALLRIANSQALGFAAAFLIGIALGAEGDVMPYLTSRYFGLRSFGEICGFNFAGFALAGGLGAYLMGAAFDAKGSYAMPLAFFSIAALSGAVLVMVLGSYPYGTAQVVDGTLDRQVRESPTQAKGIGQ